MWPSDIRKPSDKVRDALTGKGPVTPDIAPMCDRECYLAALEIIRNGYTQDKRKSMLDRIPRSVRPMVEEHIKRLWPKREEIKRNKYF